MWWLQPVVDAPFIWRGRRPPQSDAPYDEIRDDLNRSKRESRRKRTAAVHGLRLSLLLGLLVGWVFVDGNPASGAAGGDQCTEIGNALGPTLKRKIRKSLGSNGAPNGQDNALSMQVCDPTLVAMLPTLGAQIAQAPDFGEMTKLFKGNGNDMTSLAVIKTLWSSGAKRGL